MSHLSDRPGERPWVGSAAGIFVAIYVAFGALHDITAGREPDVTFEYAALVVCAGWLLFLSVQLLRRGHRVLGGVSLAALLAALWAQPAIGPGIVPGLSPEYVATVAAFVWFVALGFALLLLGYEGSSPIVRAEPGEPPR